jgi:hypothetical protein
MNDEVIVTMRDVRAARMCSRGVRMFFTTRGWDYDDFLRNGISSSILEADGDALALRAVEAARERRQ